MNPLLSFENLTLGYDKHPAVHHLDGHVAVGSLIAVVGPNGAGKSTLLKGIVGILKPLGGRIVRSGSLSDEIAYLPQISEIDRTFPATVFDLVSLGLWARRGMLGRITARDREAIDVALASVGLAGFQGRGIDTLSGGQLQRALFARVLLQDARLVLLDEPFNAIDSRTVRDLIDIIRRWHGEERTVLVVLHDLDIVREHFPETLLLSRRPVAWGETRETLKPENLLAARRLNEGLDEDAPWCEERAAA
jgi:zinc/manganese transport system ATP-binding protein